MDNGPRDRVSPCRADDITDDVNTSKDGAFVIAPVSFMMNAVNDFLKFSDYESMAELGSLSFLISVHMMGLARWRIQRNIAISFSGWKGHLLNAYTRCVPSSESQTYLYC